MKIIRISVVIQSQIADPITSFYSLGQVIYLEQLDKAVLDLWADWDRQEHVCCKNSNGFQ